MTSLTKYLVLLTIRELTPSNAGVLPPVIAAGVLGLACSFVAAR